MKDSSAAEVYSYLTYLIAPIAPVSTVRKNRAVDLSPFSFFNLFSANPPIVIFSFLRSTRDTLHDVMEVSEAMCFCLKGSRKNEMAEQYPQQLIAEGRTRDAWQVLLRKR